MTSNGGIEQRVCLFSSKYRVIVLTCEIISPFFFFFFGLDLILIEHRQFFFYAPTLFVDCLRFSFGIF